jgi:hypothetical protein
MISSREVESTFRIAEIVDEKAAKMVANGYRLDLVRLREETAP